MRLALVLSLIGGVAMAHGDMRVACVAEAGAGPLPEGLCAQFVEIVTVMAHGGAVTVTAPSEADLVLSVTEAAPYAITARLNRAEARSMRRRGAPLDRAAYAVFLRALLDNEPMP